MLVSQKSVGVGARHGLDGRRGRFEKSTVPMYQTGLAGQMIDRISSQIGDLVLMLFRIIQTRMYSGL